MNILYVEDDELLSRSLKNKLERWYNVDLAESYRMGLSLADSREYDLIILDHFLPDLTGLSLCKAIRVSNNSVFILMLTENYSKNSIVKALDAGADDYLTKPFTFHELLARIRSLIRRSSLHGMRSTLCCGDFELNQKHMELYFKNIKIKLKRKEFLILQYLLLHKEQIISRHTLYEHVWTDDYYSSNTVDVHIRRIRNKIEKPFGVSLIHTVYGAGYCIKEIV